MSEIREVSVVSSVSIVLNLILPNISLAIHLETMDFFFDSLKRAEKLKQVYNVKLCW